MARDAIGAGLIPRFAIIDARSDRSLDAHGLHHAIHRCDLMENPIEGWPAVAEIAHVPPSLALTGMIVQNFGVTIDLRHV